MTYRNIPLLPVPRLEWSGDMGGRINRPTREQARGPEVRRKTSAMAIKTCSTSSSGTVATTELTSQAAACPICGAADHRLLFLARDRHYGIGGDFPIAQCAGCGLVFLDPMPSESELEDFYPKDYYAYQAFLRRSAFREFFAKTLGLRRGTRDPSFKKPGIMLDLGCGSGWFLEEMKTAGWEVQGVEISAAAAELGKRRGIPIYAGTVSDAAFPTAHFDYVRSNHSFEHIRCPNETLRE